MEQVNKTSNYEFTVLIPVFNEEENIERLNVTLNKFIEKTSIKTCVLFVNDGSTDKSLEHIRKVCLNNPDFFYISLSENRGLSAALKAGIDVVQSKYIGYMDADLQTTPEDFNSLLPFLNDYELVTGIRANRKDTGFKKLQSKIANHIRRLLINDGVQDTGCPLKVMHTSVARKVPFFNGMHRFLPALVLLQRGKVKQVPVYHFPRIAGQSKYNMWNRLISPLIDCFAYRWMRQRYINYNIDEESILNR